MSSTQQTIETTSPAGLSIVLPTFNEGDSIASVIGSLLTLSEQEPLEILVVDDDSSDGTTETVRAMALRDPVSYTHLTLPTT